MKRQVTQSISLVLVLALSIPGLAVGQGAQTQPSQAQAIETGLSRAVPAQRNVSVFSHDELNKKWAEFTQNRNWKVLENALASKKFHRILNKEAAWGFGGTIINDKGQRETVLLCLFDFLNPANIKQGASMLWATVGTKTYKAYIVFPEGETKDISRKFELAEEWYVDETKGTINKASSWGKTFRKCVQRGVEAPNIETELPNNTSVIRIGCRWRSNRGPNRRPKGAITAKGEWREWLSPGNGEISIRL